MGRKRVVIETDSEEVAKYLNTGSKPTIAAHNILEACKKELRACEMWKVVITARETNKVADALAKLAKHRPIGVHLLPVPSLEVECLVEDDIVGMQSWRNAFNLLKCSGDPIATIVESTYPSYSNIFDDPTYLEKRAILAPTLDVVDSINEYMTSLNTYEGNTYFSFDSACKSDSNVDLLADMHTLEFLNWMNCPGVPNHELRLKVGTPVLLLRNIDH
ncbi:uncharacterized protein LOC116015712 [Ipomoea triloba]|uniref:uncharacterized protein LOC116015712 n=1 Tax=Ipomoea triloba TaxID=35885 RepID=UPI00125E76B6|nr:uncharacterized protein LOC116015712 [Ipomoea triloba]